MKTISRQYKVLILLFFAALIALPGCPKKTEVSSAPEGQPPQKTEQAKESSQQGAVTAPSQGNQPGENSRAHEGAEQEKSAVSAEGLRPVYFDFDRSFIRDDAKAVMKSNAAWLKAHPNVKIKIEGNCDERGTREYNQALGQRRAASAKKYLTDLGISGKRISLISYGKEKPVCSEGTEACWQKNRKDDFVVHQ